MLETYLNKSIQHPVLVEQFTVEFVFFMRRRNADPMPLAKGEHCVAPVATRRIGQFGGFGAVHLSVDVNGQRYCC